MVRQGRQRDALFQLLVVKTRCMADTICGFSCNLNLNFEPVRIFENTGDITGFGSLGYHSLKIVRLPDTVVGGLMFYRDSSILCLSSFFISYPPSSLNGTQTKPAI